MGRVGWQKPMAGVLAGLALSACALAPVASPVARSVTRLDAPADTGLYLFMAWDNELDWGRSIPTETTAAAARSHGVKAVALYDGSLTNPNLLFSGLPGGHPDSKVVSEPDTGTTEGLEQFLTQAQQVAPAQRRVLSLIDHGGGILRGVCIDEHDDDHPHVIHVAPLAATLAKHPVDVLLFDACYMNMAEVAYALRGGAKVIVGGQNILHGHFPYATMVSQLDAGRSQDVQTLAKGLLASIDHAAEYDTVAFGAVDTTRMPALAERVTDLVKAMRGHLPAQREAMLQAIANAQPYAENAEPSQMLYNAYRDFGSVMGELAKLPLPDVKQAAEAALAAQRQAVLAKAVHPGDGLTEATTSGLALYAAAGMPVDARYIASEWNKATGWGDLLVQLNAGSQRGGGLAQDRFPFSFPKRPR